MRNHESVSLAAGLERGLTVIKVWAEVTRNWQYPLPPGKKCWGVRLLCKQGLLILDTQPSIPIQTQMVNSWSQRISRPRSEIRLQLPTARTKTAMRQDYPLSKYPLPKSKWRHGARPRGATLPNHEKAIGEKEGILEEGRKDAWIGVSRSPVTRFQVSSQAKQLFLPGWTRT